MIEVFKTDVKGIRQAKKLVALLLANWPVCRVNFDLDDCDKVLRVEGAEFCTNRIVELLKLNGHNCEVLN
ncbi:hypothetical protein [Mucilaginibacter glaciei]|uniref:Uncharacterized protein n=1 Tax=Mucilaginibacter glaciei TaxID=2772109 RepID=A0A926S240_9SPHI|nr:hypothetical protein [Mucilaginibacter glaciei]MBD1393462.1 hypothetical protein [Mucilaginibacter glaciei]